LNLFELIIPCKVCLAQKEKEKREKVNNARRGTDLMSTRVTSGDNLLLVGGSKDSHEDKAEKVHQDI
jgi:hypothetical protein